MRFQTVPIEFEARQWTPGRPSATDNLLAWGAPVRPHGTEGITVFVERRGHHARVNPGDWIVKRPGGGGFDVVPDGKMAEYTPVAGEPETPFPVTRWTIQQVGFRRRSDPGSAAWELRNGGLSRREMTEDGWEPVYTMTEER